MHISELPNNLWWRWFDGSDQVAGLLAIILFVTAIRMLWKGSREAASFLAAGGAIFALAAYQLVVDELLQVAGLPVAALLVGILACGSLVLTMMCAERRQLYFLAASIFMLLAGSAVLIELMTSTMLALDVVNFIWWLSLLPAVTVIGGYVDNWGTDRGGVRLGEEDDTSEQSPLRTVG